MRCTTRNPGRQSSGLSAPKQPVLAVLGIRRRQPIPAPAQRRTASLIAKDFAEDWFITLKGKDRFGGGIPKGKTFRIASAMFLEEYKALMARERSPSLHPHAGTEDSKRHLDPFFGDKAVTEIQRGHCPGLPRPPRPKPGQGRQSQTSRQNHHPSRDHCAWSCDREDGQAEGPVAMEPLARPGRPWIQQRKGSADGEARPDRPHLPHPTGPVAQQGAWGSWHEILDRDGQVRTAYSLRHTYICFRLMRS